MKKRVNLKNRVSALIMSFCLALGLIAPAFTISAKAEAIEVLNGACTVADMFFSYCASGGVAIMNSSVISEVYNVLGSSFGTVQTFVDNGLLTYSNGQYVDTGLSTSIESTLQSVESIDIGALFNQTAQQNPAGVAISGAGTLAGIAGSVATNGVLPVVAGVAVSGYCGFQIGTLIANFLGLYDDQMGLGVKINTDQDIVNHIPKGSQVCYATENRSTGIQERYLYGNGVSFSYIHNDYVRFGMYNPNNSSITMGRLSLKNNIIQSSDSFDIASKNLQQFSFPLSNHGRAIAPNSFNSYDEFSNALSRWSNGGSYNKNRSPDIIGSNGNIAGTFDNDSKKYNYPNVTPKVNPENESVNPSGLTFGDYINYANRALNNYTNGDHDANKDIFDDILNSIKINEPTPAPEPDPEPEPDPDPNPNPDPETVPLPSINPYPDSYPVADPETVPDNKPQPEYTEKATENETDIIQGDPYTTPDLMNKFPFCIPRDILKIFKKMNAGTRQAPHIQWRFNPNSTIDYTFDVDFAVWDSVASLLRLLELLAFIIALGVATRNLILS